MTREFSPTPQPVRAHLHVAGWQSGKREDGKVEGAERLSFGVAFCFDPRQGGFGPIFTLFAKIPTKRGDFTASEFGAGLGIYR